MQCRDRVSFLIRLRPILREARATKTMKPHGIISIPHVSVVHCKVYIYLNHRCSCRSPLSRSWDNNTKCHRLPQRLVRPIPMSMSVISTGTAHPNSVPKPWTPQETSHPNAMSSDGALTYDATRAALVWSPTVSVRSATD